MARPPKNPYRRTTYGGHTVNWRTRAMLEVAAERLWGPGTDFTVYQGSYNTGVGASAGTHDGGGAVDLSAVDHDRKVRALRRVGFAAWYRPTLPGVWTEHIHAIAIGDKQMSSGAAAQVGSYRRHRDGLAGDGWDSFPYHPNDVSFNYQAWRNGALREAKDWFDMADKADLREVVQAELKPIKASIAALRQNSFERDQQLRAAVAAVREAQRDDATKETIGRAADRLAALIEQDLTDEAPPVA